MANNSSNNSSSSNTNNHTGSDSNGDCDSDYLNERLAGLSELERTAVATLCQMARRPITLPPSGATASTQGAPTQPGPARVPVQTAQTQPAQQAAAPAFSSHLLRRTPPRRELIEIMLRANCLAPSADQRYGTVYWSPVLAELQLRGYDLENGLLYRRITDSWGRYIKRDLRRAQESGAVAIPQGASVSEQVRLLGNHVYGLRIPARGDGSGSGSNGSSSATTDPAGPATSGAPTAPAPPADDGEENQDVSG